MLRRTLLSLSRSTKVRHLVETAPISRGTWWPASSPGRARRRPSQRPGTWWTAAGSRPRPTRRGHCRALPGRSHSRRLPHDAQAAGRRRADAGGRGLGQALGGRPVAARRRGEASRSTTRSRSARPPATPAPRSPSTWRTTPPPTRRCGILRDLRRDFPDTGAVVQAYLQRTEADCRDLAYAGFARTPVQGRLQGAGVGRLPGQGRGRPVLRALPQGADGRRRATRWWPPTTRGWWPSPATWHAATGARKGSYEYQMLYGIRPHEQQRLAARGEQMRVYVPYGDEWYGYLVRRMAERPANLVFFLRAARDEGLGDGYSGRHGSHRSARRRQDGRGAALRHAARRPQPGRPALHRPPPRARRRCSPERYGVEVRQQRRGRQERRHADPRGEAAGHGRPARRARRRTCRRTGSSSRSRPASTTAFIERRLAEGTPVVRVMSNTPVLVDEAMCAISAGATRDRGAPAAHRGDLRAGRQDDPGARVAAGRRHRAVRQRSRLLLLPRRGHDRRGHPARAAPRRRARPASCRPRSARR